MNATWSLSFAGGGPSRIFRTERVPNVGERVTCDGALYIVTSVDVTPDDHRDHPEVWAMRDGDGEARFEPVACLEFVDASTRKPVRRIISAAVPPAGLLVEGPEKQGGTFDMYRTTGGAMLASDGIGGSFFRVLVELVDQSAIDAFFDFEKAPSRDGADRLARWMVECGFTPLALAKLMSVDATGDDEARVRRWYRGGAVPPPESRARIESLTNGHVPASSWPEAR